jgi:hypothetical protein
MNLQKDVFCPISNEFMDSDWCRTCPPPRPKECDLRRKKITKIDRNLNQAKKPSKKYSEEKRKNERMYFQLWWEYLKLNDDYRELCDWARHFDFPEICGWVKYTGLFPEDNLLDQICSYYRSLPDKFKVDGQGNFSPILRGLAYFGDVYKSSFSKWWKDRENYKAIKTYDGKDFSRELKDPFKLCLAVDLTTDESAENLGLQVCRAISCRKKQVTKLLKWWNVWQQPTHPIRTDQLDLYLRVFKLYKKGFPIEQIIKELGPSKDQEDPSIKDVQRIYYRYIEKARRIIKSAGEGRFPGKY